MTRRLLPVLLASVLLTTGCFEGTFDIRVEDDGSGTLRQELIVDPDQALEVLGPLAEGFGQDAGFDRDSICEEFLADEEANAPAGSQVERFEDGSRCGIRVTYSFAASDDPGAVLQEALSADEPADPVILRREPSGGWRFETPVDTSELDDGSGELPPELAEQLFDQFKITFVVRLPGKPVEHNATSVDGNTFTWEIDIENPQDRLFAVTEPGTPDSGGGAGFLRWLLLGLAAAVLAATLLWWLRQRGRATPAVAVAPGGAGQAPPTWDPVRNAWVVTDPTGRTLVHDPASGTWRPV